MSPDNKIPQAIVQLLNSKAVVKQDVYASTHRYFEILKDVLKEVVEIYNPKVQPNDQRLELAYTDKGEFVVQLKVAGDVLVFHMHTNAFVFDRDHEVWKSEYVTNNLTNAYCGVINIYNFLHDSFRYNRLNDLGYLIARVFINKDGHYFVEGKRQKGTGINHFGTSVMNEENWKQIVETAVLYALEFDLLVPPYDDMKIISLMQMTDEMLNSRMRTGKRLGFIYNSDDVKQ
ncbi:hypothetical protein [Carboxylicivirga caseinilyticus]|uniref:hypothetical protein n=1 Tax=Carboxylicivirga caseinilyticus TaxID=3417572 RepID=UPI003D33B062|nr:hypothetical protein [Marinilabiliaceae bacterium A049]